MSQHSPGPWMIFFDGSGRPCGIEAPNDALKPGAVGLVVRARGIGLPSSPTALANARLIAAAPDLLAACQAMLTCLDVRMVNGPQHRAITMARDAIAKATGQGGAA